MKMVKSRTIDEWIFALAVYPKFNAIDRYSLFVELLEKEGLQYKEYISSAELLNKDKKIKKLSTKKKASFAYFLKNLDIRAEMDKYQSQNISWKYIYSVDYPSLLRKIYMPPLLIFYRGDYSILENHISLGVVGSRLASEYGLNTVKKLIPGVIKQSKGTIAVVSGLAKGIDGQAHKETIKSGGRTVGVIGSGLDYSYPHENKSLQKKMMNEELVLSEYPLGAKPLAFHFPERNRIIAGLSRGVLVIEARKRSGSLITAYNALDENRDIFACPGSLLTKSSEGCHKLIQSGAYLTIKSEDILKEWFLI